MIVIVMGVAASGKTTVGKALAARQGFRFYDADAHHSPENIARMRAGRPLDDQDRAGWLRSLRVLIDDCHAHQLSAVIACSALKEQYRRTLRARDRDVVFVHLKVDVEIIRARLRLRTGHFAGENLLASQLETLEEPRCALVVDGSLPIGCIVEDIARRVSSLVEE